MREREWDQCVEMREQSESQYNGLFDNLITQEHSQATKAINQSPRSPLLSSFHAVIETNREKISIYILIMEGNRLHP